MKPFYNTIAITSIAFWGIIFYNTDSNSWIHLFLLPIIFVLIYDIVIVIKLLNKS